MNKTLYFLLLLSAFAPCITKGQGCDALIKDARTLAKKLQFDDAIKKVEAAKGCAAQADIDKLYTEIFAGLKKQTNDANKAKERANIAEREAINAKAQTDSALQKAQKLIDAFYFYDGKFALAYGRKLDGNVFYFIDKNGNEVAKLGRWEKAEQFDWRGFAKIKTSEEGALIDYLLDTLGNIYRVAYDVKDLREDITALDLSEKGLSSIPAEVFKQTSLKILLLNSNELSILPAEIVGLKNLTALYLGDNHLSSLSSEIGELKNLTSLELGFNQLSILPPAIMELKNLTNLVLLYNQLSSLPPEIGGLKSLTTLDLRYNQLSRLPAEIGELKNLTILYLYDNELSSLPAEIGGLKNLTELDLSANQLDSLPSEIKGLKNLTNLELSSNQLNSLPIEIGGLKNLNYLDLSENQLSSLPPEIKNLAKMKELELNATLLSIEEINKALSNTPQIEVLYLGNLRLTRMPESVFQLKNLKKLVLQNRDDLEMYKKEDFNNFSAEEQENIRKRLPGVEIEF